MNSHIEAFKENIIKKYSKDINNIYMIQDYLLLDNLEECIKIISEIFNNEEEEKIQTQSNGSFSILINNKFLLIAKKNELINIIKPIYKFLLIISKNIDSKKDFIMANIKELLSLINIVLLFNDNISFYALKKKILLLSLNCKNNHEINNNNFNLNDTLLSEYYFTCTTNKKCRKSAISWDYKYFLFHNFKEYIFIKEEKNNVYEYIYNLLKNEINLLGIKKDLLLKDLFIIKDIEVMNEINIIQSRNYHMWTYLRKIFNEGNKEEKILIILFAFLTLKKCSFDYSAFTFIVNSRNNMPLNKEEIESLIKGIKKASFIKYDDHKYYIDDLEKFFD